MQNRYFADVGDFGKYALLENIIKGDDNLQIDLAVVWYLYPEEFHNKDGRHISYLSRGDMRTLAPELFDFLQKSIRENVRRVSAIEGSGLLPANTVFFGNLISIDGGAVERVKHRTSWFQECLSSTKACDVIFLDPDNGVEIASVNRRHPKAGKYLFWDEICSFLDRDKSLIIYHHLNRTASVTEQMHKMAAKFHDVLPNGFRLTKLVFRRGSCRSYWLLLRNDIADIAEPRIEKMLESGWRSHFEKA